MAKKPTSSPAPRAANLSPLQMRAAIPKLERRLRELEEFDITTITKSDKSTVHKLEHKIDATLTEVFGRDTIEYNRCAISSLWRGTMAISMVPREYTIEEERDDYKKGIASAKAKIKSAIETISEQLDDTGESESGRRLRAIEGLESTSRN